MVEPDINKQSNSAEKNDLFDETSKKQYTNLRNNFNKLVTEVLGPDYYNMAMDVYEADRICCEDIAIKANMGWIERLLDK